MDLKILGPQAGALCDAREHLGSDLIAIVEREDDVGPTRALQRSMRPTLTLDAPSDPKERAKHYGGTSR